MAIIWNKKMFRPYPVLPLQGSTFTSECRKYRIGEGRDLWRRVPKHFKSLSYLEGNSTRTTLWWVGTTALIILGSNHPVSVCRPMAPKESYTATKTTLQNYKLFLTCKEKSYHYSFFRYWHSPAAAASSGNTDRNSGQSRTIGGSVGNIVDTLINLFA